MGLSRNKVAVPEGAAGTPPFWSVRPRFVRGCLVFPVRSVALSCLYLKECIFSLSGGLAQLARALAWHARGHRFDPDILHHAGTVRLRSLTYWNRKDCRKQTTHRCGASCCPAPGKESKGAWWMPRLTEAMKDVTSCDNPRRGASGLGPGGLRMGQPAACRGGIPRSGRRTGGTETS